MKRSAKEKLKAALLAAAREELARFEALPADGLAFSPDFEERFRALSEGAKKPDRPVRAFPLRRLIAPVAAALVLLFLFVVPVSADGRTIATVVKEVFIPSPPQEIKEVYTLDLLETDYWFDLIEEPTRVTSTWTNRENRKETIYLSQYVQDERSYYVEQKQYFEETIADGKVYYAKENENSISVCWRAELYDFVLEWCFAPSLEECFDLIRTLHVAQPQPSPDLSFTFSDGYSGWYSVDGYTGDKEDLIIPSYYNLIRVERIGRNALRDLPIKSLYLPYTVQQIGNRAFAGCAELKEVTILCDYVVFGKEVFEGCDQIERVTCYNASILSQFPSARYATVYSTQQTIPLPVGENLECLSLRGAVEKLSSVSGTERENAKNLKEVELPATLKEIDHYVFQSCKNLQKIVLPERLEKIGSGAFSGCETLETVTIPKNVTSIGEGPFMGCLSLREINVDPENPVYSSVDGVLFTKDGKELLQYPGGKTGAYRIPDEVEKIHAAAFRSCAGLTEITLPAGKGWLDSAGSKVVAGSMEYAFTLFHDCSAIQAVWIDGEDPQICSVDGILFNKEKTTLLYYPGGREGAYEIPDGVSILAFGAFRGCRGLTAVTLPETLTVIGAAAFQKCSSLTSMHIPYSVTLIRGSAFYDCDNLTAYTYDGTLAEWDAIQAKMDGIPAPYTVTAADGIKELPQKR